VDTTTITPRVRELLADRLRVPASDIPSGAAPLKESLSIDSMALMQLVTGIEEEFDLELDDSEMSIEVFESVDSIVAFVTAKLEG
jgi:acyl carrier protein